MIKIFRFVLSFVFLSFCTQGLMAASVPQKNQGAACFFVSPDGDDSARGTQKHPWRSLKGVAANVSAYMADHPGCEVTVRFAGGEYPMKGVAKFENLTSPLTLEAFGDGEPVICGSIPVPGWEKTVDRDVLSVIPESAEGRIWQADLRSCGITNFGDVISRTNRPDLYCDGKRQTLSRWPDSSLAEAGKAVGVTDLEKTWINVHGTVEGCLEYVDDRISKWAGESDACIFGYWYWDWADGYSRLASVDRENKRFSVSKPWSKYGYRDGMRFFGLNLLCELDAPGEYYIDKDKGIIYWYPPHSFDPAKSCVELSVSKARYMITVNQCANLSFDGFTFKGGRNGALKVTGGSSIVVLNSRFTCFGENVIWLDGGVNHRIAGCKLDELGASGIRLSGGDRKTLEPCGFRVENTVVDNFSLFKRTYEPAILVEGVGMTVSNCLFTHSSSSALRLDGNDILIQYCQFFDLVTESDDQGGSDSWFNYTFRRLTFKYNHFRNIRGGMFAGAAAIRFDDIISGNIVYGNVFERCGGSLFGAVNINAGRDNHLNNNIFYDCPSALSGCAGQGEGWKEQMEMNRDRIDEVNGLGPVYSIRYPELRPSFDSDEGFNYLYDNITVNVPVLCNYPGLTKSGNNTEITGDTKGLDHYLQHSVQQAAGLSPIPFEDIGVKSNRFIQD